MIGELGTPDEAQRRVFVVQYADSATGNGYRHSGQTELGHNWVGLSPMSRSMASIPATCTI